MAPAVIGLSPVIMRTSMPALSAVATASFASARSGSIMPAMPTKARPWVIAIGSAFIASTSSSAIRRVANASTRRPFSPMRALAASSSARTSAIGTCEPLSGPPDSRAAIEHDVGAALDQLDDVLDPVDGHAVEGGHELVGGVERHLGQPRVGAPRLLGVHAELRRQHDERRLGRVADHGAVVGDRGVGVEREPEREAGEVGHRDARDRLDRAGLLVALAGDREPVAARVEGRDHHLVHRQRAGLVGVDRRSSRRASRRR